MSSNGENYPALCVKKKEKDGVFMANLELVKNYIYSVSDSEYKDSSFLFALYQKFGRWLKESERTLFFLRK